MLWDSTNSWKAFSASCWLWKCEFQTLMAAQAAKKGGGHLAALSWQNLWLSSCVGLFMRTLCNKSLVVWNWIIRTCKNFKLCGDVIKKQNTPSLGGTPQKVSPQGPVFCFLSSHPTYMRPHVPLALALFCTAWTVPQAVNTFLSLHVKPRHTDLPSHIPTAP